MRCDGHIVQEEFLKNFYSHRKKWLPVPKNRKSSFDDETQPKRN